MTSATPLEQLDAEFDEELGLPQHVAPSSTPSTEVTGGQKLALLIVVGLFLLLVLAQTLSLIALFFLGTHKLGLVVWTAKLSALLGGIFGSAFITYIVVLVVGFVGITFAPEFLHPRVLGLDTKQKLVALVPLIPIGVFYLIDRALVSYLTGLL